MHILIRILIVFNNIIYVPLVWIFSIIYHEEPASIPPITDSVLTISADTIARNIRDKKCTSYEVVRAYIERIKKINPYINAVVDERFEDALTEAKHCDALLKAGNIDIVTLRKQKPLFGVPLTVKESCPVKGLSNSGCSLPIKGRKADADSVVIQILRDAGAIPLCVSNTPELCSSFNTSNFVYGTTYNPYDTRYTPGGSSGGEGALLGAGASLIGIGSDLGGSVRVPGLFCGIYGLKPTPRLIPSMDHFPMIDDENFQNYNTFGPMARYADDLSLLMRVITTKSNVNLRLDEPVDWKQTKVYYFKNLHRSLNALSISPDFEESVLQVKEHFSRRGSHTEELPIEWPTSLLEMILTKYKDAGLIDVFANNRNFNVIVEMIKSMFGLSDYTMSVLYFNFLMKYVNLVPRKETLQYPKKFKELQQQLQKILGNNGILICPTYRTKALFSGLIIGEIINGIAYSSWPSVFGFPAVQIPTGLDKKGMPKGVQIIAAPYQERLCLAAAKELEATFGGWVPPSI